MITFADVDLVIPRPGVEGYEVQSAIAIAKILDGIVAARDRVCKGESDCMQFAIADTHSPYKLIDIRDVFLVGFRG